MYGRPIHSNTPCTQPSSPQRPCKALNTTDGAAMRKSDTKSGPASILTTLYPACCNAEAHSCPDDRETSRSAPGPPINTAIFSGVLLDIPTFSLQCLALFWGSCCRLLSRSLYYLGSPTLIISHSNVKPQ